MEDVATMTIFDSPKEDSKPGNRSRHESKASSISAVNVKKEVARPTLPWKRRLRQRKRSWECWS